MVLTIKILNIGCTEGNTMTGPNGVAMISRGKRQPLRRSIVEGIFIAHA